MGLAQSPGPVCATVFPEFIARELPGACCCGVKETSAGWVRPAATRGHGPARLDATAARATVAGVVMKEGKTDALALRPRTAPPHASVSAQRRRREGRSGVAGSAVGFQGSQAQRGGDWRSRSPGGGKRSAQALFAGGVRDQRLRPRP